MRLIVTALALVFMASFANAEISWQVGRFGPGTELVMKNRAETFTHIKRGAQSGVHTFDVFGAGQDYLGSYQTNDRGDILRSMAFDGAITQFVPSRCNRTVGECRFTVIHPDGFQEPRTRVTVETRDGLHYREYGLDGLMAEGELDLDKDGTPEGGWIKDKLKDKTRTTFKRVLIAMK